MKSYSPSVVMKSIDEGVMDFHEVRLDWELIDIGYEIKKRLSSEIGEAVRCNVGIGTNRFLAKVAAGLHKPDGLDVIEKGSLREILAGLELTDLAGIAGGYEKRLKAVGVDTPVKLLDSSEEALQVALKSQVVGRQWYLRIRGYEVDNREFGVKTIGRQFVLDRKDLTKQEVLARFYNLCESLGERLRGRKLVARGVRVDIRGVNSWHKSYLSPLPFFSNLAIYKLAERLLEFSPYGARQIGVRLYCLDRDTNMQLSIFGDELMKEVKLAEAIDKVNQRFGDRTLHSASTLNTNLWIVNKVPFGSTKYL